MPDIVALAIDQIMLLQERDAAARPGADARLQDDLALTSLNMISLITTLCEILDIDLARLSDVELANLHTVNDLAQMLDVCAAA